MARVTLRWHGDAFNALLEREMSKRLDAIGAVVSSEAAKLISEPYPPASQPGEPPHIRTVHLRRSVFWERVRNVVRIGTPLLYGLFLELGTRTMAPRPWLRVALTRSRERIRRIMAKRLPGA